MGIMRLYISADAFTQLLLMLMELPICGDGILCLLVNFQSKPRWIDGFDLSLLLKQVCCAYAE